MNKKKCNLVIFLAVYIITLSFSAFAEDKTITSTQAYLLPKYQPLEASKLTAEKKAVKTALEKAVEYLQAIHLIEDESYDKNMVMASIYFHLITDMTFDLKCVFRADGSVFIETKTVFKVSTGDAREAYHKIVNDKHLLNFLTEMSALNERQLNKEMELSNRFKNDFKTLSKKEMDDLLTAYNDLSKEIQINHYHFLALAYWENDRFTMPLQALEYLEKAYLNDPDNTRTLMLRGIALKELGLHKRALTDFSNLINHDPENKYALINRGCVYSKLENYNKAVIDFNKAAALFPDDMNIYLGRGNVFEKMEKYDEAAKDYSKVIETLPAKLTIYFKRANMYKKMGRTSDAEADYASIIDRNPQNAAAFYQLGLLKMNVGDYDQALDMMNKAVEMENDGAEIYKDRGYLYHHMGRADDACADFEKACEFGNCSGIFWAKKQNVCK